MTTLIRKAILVNLLTCILASAYAQKIPIKWGQVDQEDLAMTHYEPDPSASAVVLCDFGELYFHFTNDVPMYTLTHHKRIKILNREGFSEGDISILFHADAKVSKLKAQVIAPDGTKQSLSRQEMYKEKVIDDWYRQKFSFPGLQKGSVIEYRYEMSYTYTAAIPKWRFQEEIPVRWSEYRIEMLDWLDYASYTQGRQPDIVEQNPSSRVLAIYGTESLTVPTKHLRYVMKDIPALKEEPFITNMEDYYAMIRFQVKGIQPPTSSYQSFARSWAELAGDYKKEVDWDKKSQIKDLLKVVTPAVNQADSPQEKIVVLYQFLSNNIEWDGTYSFLPEQKLEDCFTNSKANSGELNLLLIALANQFDIEAYPMLISTRSNGKMIPWNQDLSQFNHVIAIVKIGEDMQAFDVGDPLRPMSHPRINALNQQGWIADPAKPQWVGIPNPGNKSTQMFQLSINESGNMIGNFSGRYEGYTTISSRRSIQSKGAKAYLTESMRAHLPEITIDQENIKNVEEVNHPLSITFNCEIADMIQENGDFLYISPVLLPEYTENPLKLEERTFPVDLAHTANDRYILMLDIPEGYAVEELPEKIRMTLPNSGAIFDFSCIEIGNKVKVTSTLRFSQVEFLPAEYKALKNFFNLIIEKQEEQIVLKKKT